MDKAREQHNVLMDKGREQLTAFGVSCYINIIDPKVMTIYNNLNSAKDMFYVSPNIVILVPPKSY